MEKKKISKKVIETAIEPGESKVYELGFHLSPAVPMSAVAGEIEKIKAKIIEFGGSIIASEDPVMTPLAYPMSYLLAGKKTIVNQAHFSWVKFDLDKNKALSLKTFLDQFPHLVRFLLINTVKESTMPPKKPIILKATAPTTTETKVIDSTEGEAEKPVISEAELDRTIEELVIK
jgi:ribosomal protein S6